MPYNKHNFQEYEVLYSYQLNDMDNQIYDLTPKYRNLMNTENKSKCYGSGATATTLSEATRADVSYFAELVPYTDYVVKKTNDGNDSKRFGVCLCDSVTNGAACKTIAYKASASETETATFNSENYKYVVVFCKPGSSAYEFPDVQLEIGTTATDYVDYGTETHDEVYALKPDGGMYRINELIAQYESLCEMMDTMLTEILPEMLGE